MIKRGYALFSLLAVLVGFQNCSKANFKTSAASLAYQSCTEQLGTTSFPIKVLFVVDTSGSNAGLGGSDPNKTVRGGSIGEFFNAYRSRSNFSWSFIHFSGSNASSLIGGSANPIFTTSTTQMQTAINSFYSIFDDGLTPYQAALNMTRQAIAGDSPSAAPNTKYVVVFLSDGVPDPAVADSVLRSSVQNILAVRPNQISFNTIYYGAADAEANARLKNMAAAGAGQFLDTNASAAGKQFVISDVINVAGLNCGSAN
jgi:Mg-chelatase subunit ChlD